MEKRTGARTLGRRDWREEEWMGEGGGGGGGKSLAFSMEWAGTREKETEKQFVCLLLINIQTIYNGRQQLTHAVSPL